MGKSLGFVEVLLIQVIIWTSLWLYDDYLGSLLTVVMVPIFFFILVIALISELIERSKVPKRYFMYMIVSICVPLVIGLGVYVASSGYFDWLQEIG